MGSNCGIAGFACPAPEFSVPNSPGSLLLRSIPIAALVAFGAATVSRPSEIQSVSDKIVHVTDDTFEDEVLKSSEPVLVDYWADWCGPCKMIAPVLDEIADEYAGRVKIAKLNIDENPNTPPRYGIRGIPTLMLFKDGEVEATKVGAVSKSQLTAFIDSNA
jgi:thioredoxin 1